jgi:uncharacterized membrane protein (UPF0127 family)
MKLSRQGQQSFNTIFCSTGEEKALGLQGVVDIPNNTILAFEGVSQGDFFHMRNCAFPIDWLCVSNDGTILKKEALHPEDDVAGVAPGTKYVIEAKLGTFSGNKGDQIDLTSLKPSGGSVFDLSRNK